MSQWKDFLFPECYKLQRTYTVYFSTKQTISIGGHTEKDFFS